MKLYDTTTPHTSLIHEIWDLCDANITSYPLKDVLRRINSSLEQIVGWIIDADGTAQFDDTNYTSFPVATYNLVAEQAKYSFNDKFLQIMNVQILDKNGDRYLLEPIDQSQFLRPLEEEFATSGAPIYYDQLTDDTIKLYPAPDNGVSVTLASGLRIYFKRTIKLYTMSDSTTITSGEESVEPGIASPYHILIAYMAAIPYCMKYKKDRVVLYEKKATELKTELINHYGRREKDVRKIITIKPIQYE